MKSLKLFLIPMLLIHAAQGQSVNTGRSETLLKQVEYRFSKAHAVPLHEVRLLESPFRHAMERDAEWLLSLEPDRFLYRFRLNAGLQPKDSIYGGWEALGVSGHSLGHYLSACALMYAASGDVRFKEKGDYIVTELAACQAARKTGYVGGIPNEDKIFNEVAAGDIRSQGFDLNGGWVPWYTQHKVLAGLIDAYRFAGNEAAKKIALKFADWIAAKFSGLSDEQFEKMLDCEHGGMNESLADLYAITGDKKYLDLSYRFNHKKILDPLSQRRDILPGRHANTQIPKIIGAARQYELTGSDKEKNTSDFFWNQVVAHHSYVIGGNSDHEHFGKGDSLANRLSTNTAETCNSYNMLKLTRHLFSRNPSAHYMDYYERTLYNHILASQNPADGMTCYFVPLAPGSIKTYGTPAESFWCCTGTGMENHVKYGESIYYEGSDGSLYVNLFIPSTLDRKEKGYSLKLETAYPEKETVKMTLETVRGRADFPIHIRYPKWAVGGIEVKINGQKKKINDKPGSYVTLKKSWKSADVISIKLPMSLYEEAMPDKASRRAILYGPLVLAGGLGASPVSGMGVPVFIEKPARPADWVKPSGEPLQFTVFSESANKNISLLPFYKMHGQHYTVYWDQFTKAEWQGKRTAYEQELKRLQELKDRTVDELRIGEMQPERDHNLKGESTETGEAFGRKWRHAVNGWFQFDMAVTGAAPLQLLCTYWGGDAGREFDILIDGKGLTTQKLQNQKPNEFMEVAYALPPEWIQGKGKVTVRFQAAPGSTAGGLFGCRVLKPKP